MKNPKSAAGKNLQKTIDRLTAHKRAPIGFFILLVALYIAGAVVTSLTAGMKGVAVIGGASIQIYSFAGVLQSMGNICIIFMAVFYGKLGFFTAMTALLVQFPMILMGILVRNNLSSLPGVFSNCLALVAIFIIYVNNQKIEKIQIRLRDQAVTDILTGLPNRFACTELLNELVKKGETFSIVSIDLNNFKSINDTMGHNTGNDVLKAVAERWRSIADTGISGTNDFVTRQGGDEFALIIRDYRSEEEVLKTIRHYETVLSNRITIDECDYFITASFGFAEFPRDTKSADTLLSYADAAMYEVKRANSGNHILRFTPELLKMEHTLEIERKIRTALEEDGIYFMLQPQYDISHNLRGFEALARIRDVNGSTISPGEFIPVAEKVGLIDKVDLAVFRKSAAFFGQLIRKSGAEITLSVNASVRHLMKNGFLDEVSEILESSGIPACQLEIEITESVMIDSADKALQCINDIKAMGIKIAIDDFGTGYSSLSYLNNFPADLLKVDKSFIDKMNTSDSSKQYVAAIISIGHIMNFEVISEGVEQPEQLETLRSIGCDFIQGFIWGRPLDADAAEALVMETCGKKNE